MVISSAELRTEVKNRSERREMNVKAAVLDSELSSYKTVSLAEAVFIIFFVSRNYFLMFLLFTSMVLILSSE